MSLQVQSKIKYLEQIKIIGNTYTVAGLIVGTLFTTTEEFLGIIVVSSVYTNQAKESKCAYLLSICLIQPISIFSELLQQGEQSLQELWF